eukprot:IDg7433t1
MLRKRKDLRCRSLEKIIAAIKISALSRVTIYSQNGGRELDATDTATQNDIIYIFKFLRASIESSRSRINIALDSEYKGNAFFVPVPRSKFAHLCFYWIYHEDEAIFTDDESEFWKVGPLPRQGYLSKRCLQTFKAATDT